jgi:hypothetical protein
MPKTGRYCKAYHLSRLRRYRGWIENMGGIDEASSDSRAHRSYDDQLTDMDIVYLHDNFAVTRGVFIDENIVFENNSPEWITFCTSTLGFQLTDDCRGDTEGRSPSPRLTH